MTGKADNASDLGQRLAAGRWKAVGAVSEGQRIRSGGANPWEHKWEPRGAHVQLPHPLHRQERHRMDIFQFTVGPRTIVFAAGELSPGVFGFYVPAR